MRLAGQMQGADMAAGEGDQELSPTVVMTTPRCAVRRQGRQAGREGGVSAVAGSARPLLAMDTTCVQAGPACPDYFVSALL